MGSQKQYLALLVGYPVQLLRYFDSNHSFYVQQEDRAGIRFSKIYQLRNYATKVLNGNRILCEKSLSKCTKRFQKTQIVSNLPLFDDTQTLFNWHGHEIMSCLDIIIKLSLSGSGGLNVRYYIIDWRVQNVVNFAIGSYLM